MTIIVLGASALDCISDQRFQQTLGIFRCFVVYTLQAVTVKCTMYKTVVVFELPNGDFENELMSIGEVELMSIGEIELPQSSSGFQLGAQVIPGLVWFFAWALELTGATAGYIRVSRVASDQLCCVPGHYKATRPVPVQTLGA